MQPEKKFKSFSHLVMRLLLREVIDEGFAFDPGAARESSLRNSARRSHDDAVVMGLAAQRQISDEEKSVFWFKDFEKQWGVTVKRVGAKLLFSFRSPKTKC